MTFPVRFLSLIALTLVTLVPRTPALAEEAASPADGVEKTVLADARQAGIRYGQAAGMAAVCENMQPTAKAQSLATSFSGKDLDLFKVQAETVLASWKKTLTCTHINDPNPCRLAHQMSCREAYREIGPNGTIVAGLVELKPAP